MVDKLVVACFIAVIVVLVVLGVYLYSRIQTQNSIETLFLSDIGRASNITNIEIEATSYTSAFVNGSYKVVPVNLTLYKQGNNGKIVTMEPTQVGTMYLVGNVSLNCLRSTDQQVEICLGWSPGLFNIYENSYFPASVNSILFALNGNGRTFEAPNQTLYQYFINDLAYRSGGECCDVFTFNFTSSSVPLNVSIAIDKQSGVVMEYKNTQLSPYYVTVFGLSLNVVNSSSDFSLPVKLLVQNSTCSASTNKLVVRFTPLISAPNGVVFASMNTFVSAYNYSLDSGNATTGPLQYLHNYTVQINLTASPDLSYYISNNLTRAPVDFYLSNYTNAVLQGSCTIIQ